MINNYSKNNKCKICNKSITDNAKLCNSCERKNRYIDKSNTPNWKDGKYSIINECMDCSKIISSEAIRCHSCALKELYKNPKNHPKYKDGISLKKANCIDCGKEVSDCRHKRCQKCHQEYVTLLIIDKKLLKGKNHPNWHGGISKYGYPYIFNLELKESIRKRDGYICQLCNKKAKHVHHIDYNKQNCKKNNLITLCHKCNIRVNYNRSNWIKYFKKLINKILRRK
jgi:DNA-directed RNA polymerase subunit RPC12/RpoP